MLVIILRRCVRLGTLFEMNMFSMSSVLLITYLWLRKDSANYDAYDFEVNRNSGTDWFSLCRKVCVNACFDDNEYLGVRAKMLKLITVCSVWRRPRIKRLGL